MMSANMLIGAVSTLYLWTLQKPLLGFQFLLVLLDGECWEMWKHQVQSKYSYYILILIPGKERQQYCFVLFFCVFSLLKTYSTSLLRKSIGELGRTWGLQPEDRSFGTWICYRLALGCQTSHLFFLSLHFFIYKIRLVMFREQGCYMD